MRAVYALRQVQLPLELFFSTLVWVLLPSSPTHSCTMWQLQQLYIWLKIVPVKGFIVVSVEAIKAGRVSITGAGKCVQIATNPVLQRGRPTTNNNSIFF